MTEEPMVEATRINPGEKWKEGGTYDLTLKLAWAVIKLGDEDTRKVSRGLGWNPPGATTSEFLNRDALQQKMPDNNIYLAQWDAEGQSGSGYLNYEGFYRHRPVNQIPFLREWQPFVARSAHEFDWTISAHSLEGLSENELWTVQRQMYGLIAAPWFLMDLLAITDPTAMLGAEFEWKVYQADVENALVGLCYECDGVATFARLFAHEANLELNRGALISGKVHQSNRDVSPWGLSDNIVTQVAVQLGTTPTAKEITGFHDGNYAEFLNALEFYAKNVGASERPHSHE